MLEAAAGRQDAHNSPEPTAGRGLDAGCWTWPVGWEGLRTALLAAPCSGSKAALRWGQAAGGGTGGGGGASPGWRARRGDGECGVAQHTGAEGRVSPRGARIPAGL